jgi:hypothetical protein
VQLDHVAVFPHFPCDSAHASCKSYVGLTAIAYFIGCLSNYTTNHRDKIRYLSVYNESDRHIPIYKSMNIY